MRKTLEWLPPAPNPGYDSTVPGWKNRLLLSKRGNVLSVVANALIPFRSAPEWQGVLRFNESTMATIAAASPPFGSTPPTPFSWTDELDVLAAEWLQHEGITVNKDIAGQAIQVVAREHPFHPIRDYIEALEWDGIPRIDEWLINYLGADPSDYVRAVGAKFLIGGVARVCRPGVKNDSCLILEGPQGALKSTALRTLAGADFFADDIAELGSKDSVLQTRGVWIIELSELDAMTRGEVSRVKAFMSRQVDRIRPPYGRRVVDAPRECVFAGTVNKETYLRDETGGRRFWPVKCSAIDIEVLQRDRDQLWAEAHSRFRSGDTWWLDNPALRESAAEEAQARYEVDPWDAIVTQWLKDPAEPSAADGGDLASNKEFVTVPDVLFNCLGKQPSTWTQNDQNRVARSLTSMKWRRIQKRIPGGREWRYYPPVTSVTTIS